MNREITDKNLYLLLPSKVSLFVQLYIKEHGGFYHRCHSTILSLQYLQGARKREHQIMALWFRSFIRGIHG